MRDLSRQFLPLLREYERIHDELDSSWPEKDGVRNLADYAKIDWSPLEPVKKKIYDLTMASFSPDFFKEHHQNYVIEKIHSWHRQMSWDMWPKLKKNHIDAVYHDDIREVIFSCLGIPYHPTDPR